MTSLQRAVDDLLERVNEELTKVEELRAVLEEREHGLLIERDGLVMSQQRLAAETPDATAPASPSGSVATEKHDTITSPPLHEMTRGLAIQHVLDQHGGCELAELVALLNAHGRKKDTNQAVSVALNTLKNRGVVERFSGEWRLVQSGDNGDSTVTSEDSTKEAQVV